MSRTATIALVLHLYAGAQAAAQVSGALDWSSLGVSDENVIPSGTSMTSVGVTAIISWTTVTDGGSFIAYAGNDFLSYEDGTQGGFTGYAQLGFDNSKQDPDDQVIVDIAFSEAVANLAFTITDIDESPGGWDDFVEVYYDTGSGLINAKTGSFATLGSLIVADDETFGDGWEGDGAAVSASSDGNAAYNFGTLEIAAIRIVYFSSDDAGNNGLNPGGQQLGLSNITYDKLVPDLITLKAVNVYDPGAAGLYAVPGNDVVYTISITNSGAGEVDADTMFIVDELPPQIEFYNGDVDDGGPEIDAVAFSQSGAGMTFNYPADVAFSSSASAPLSFAACGYSPSPGYDAAVTYVCFNPKGAMPAGNPDPTISFRFRARIR